MIFYSSPCVHAYIQCVEVLTMSLTRSVCPSFSGEFPFAPVYCLAWICLDVLFCTASIMHLCTISVDRYLSLRYPMKFGRNKTRRRVILKIVFVWLLSIAMSLPLSLMYSKVSVPRAFRLSRRKPVSSSRPTLPVRLCAPSARLFRLIFAPPRCGRPSPFVSTRA